MTSEVGARGLRGRLHAHADGTINAKHPQGASEEVLDSEAAPLPWVLLLASAVVIAAAVLASAGDLASGGVLLVAGAVSGGLWLMRPR